MIQAEGGAADVEDVLERGEGGGIVPPGGEQLTEELHGPRVLGASHALFAGEQVPALFDEPLGIVQATLPLRDQAEVPQGDSVLGALVALELSPRLERLVQAARRGVRATVTRRRRPAGQPCPLYSSRV